MTTSKPVRSRQESADREGALNGLHRFTASVGFGTKSTALLASLVVAGLLLLSMVGLRLASAAGSISLTVAGAPYTQDFNTLANTGTSSTVPTGWDFSESGTNANTLYNTGTGSSNAGDTYSFGASGSTERAFGCLQSGTLIPTIGASFTNDTGSAITSLAISYTGEQWRLGTAGRADRLDFQYSTNATSLTTGTWTDVDSLDFTSPVQAGTLGALDGNAGANRTAISATINGLNIPNGATFWIRWTDFNASGADDGLAVDDFTLTPDASASPVLTIADVSVAEGNSGTTPANFTVSLTSPAGPGGVTFDISTQDNTATTADNDYVAKSLTGQTIPEGQQTYAFSVTITGDTTVEPTETFFVNVTNITGAIAGDVQAIGTITNDDVNITPIHDIQGSGSTSPLVGTSVSTTGIVTGIKSNGFFVQTPDAQADADTNTSEGIFVFTSSAPPAAAALGNSVIVTGSVQEFIPSADPNSPPTTEIAGSPVVTLLSTGNAIPAPTVLTASDTSPSGSIEQLEKFEGMRVKVDSLTVVGPTQGTISEANATATSNGVFYAVITGVARPFREPGIEVPDPLPAGAPCCVPRFDANPERLRVDSDGQVGGAAIEVTAGAVVTNLVGPLDYAFRTYTILPDPSQPPGVTGNVTFTAVPDAAPDEFTVSSFNMERFFDTVNDPGVDDVALTATAFNNRLNKASLAIRNVMRSPDIIGVEEVENLTTLQAIAAKINNDVVTGGGSDPNYQAYLFEGNDIGGIDVGFLVKATRVTVIDITQVGKDTTYINPNNGQPELLNDRPPLVLRAEVSDGSSVAPVTVIVNHLRSLGGVDDPTDGNRVRTKRRAQAEFLANLIQSRQVADPKERIISIGDYNAFQFNDGYVDSIGTVKGTPTAADEVVLASPDLVDPNLTDLLDQLPADQRYSFNFDGNAQVLDHELVNPKLFELFSRIAYARNDSDFPESFRGDPNRPERISDHDMPVAYFTFPVATADLSITKIDSPDPVVTGSDITYTIDVTNAGPDSAATVTLTDAVPSGTTFKSISAPQGWSVVSPDVGSSGLVTCSIDSLPPGTATFTLVVTVDCAVADETAIENSATVSSATLDPDTDDLTATASTEASNPPPQISCPADKLAVTAQPGDGSVAVAYAAPTVTDNCPDPSVVCVPASGTQFPVGTTTVTCTATDSAGNQAGCSFAVTVFDVCIQNDSGGASLVFNSRTGQYIFCCGGSKTTGQGAATRAGCTFILLHISPNLRVQATVNSCSGIGQATMQTPPGRLKCMIVDRDITNNTCSCVTGT
jgi:uncharacterized repeat protein (TIGR01451 family)